MDLGSWVQGQTRKMFGGAGAPSDFADAASQRTGSFIGHIVGEKAHPQLDAAKRGKEEADKLRGQLPAQQSMTYTPQTMSAMLTGPSAAAQAAPDARSVAAQREALAGLQRQAYGSGMNGIDRNSMEQASRYAGGLAAQQRGNAVRSAGARGLGQGGQSVAAQAAANNGANTFMSGAGNRMQDAAQQRALQALGASSTLGGNMDEQAFGESFARGNAADQMAQQNANRSLQANELNANNATQASVYNAQNPQRTFGLQMGIGDIGAGQTDLVRNAGLANQQARQEQVGNLVSGGLQGGTAIGNYLLSNNDEDAKKRA